LGTLNSPLPETSVSFLWALPVAAAAVIALGLFVALQLEKVREGELAMASQADADPAALPAASAPLEELGATESPSPRPPPAPGPPAAGPLPPGSPAAAELSPEQATPQAGAEFDPRLEGEASPEPPGAGPYLASEGLGDPSLGSAGGSPRDEPAARRSRRRLPATGAAEMASTKRARAGAGGSMAIGEFSPVEASPSPATTARALRRALESRASRVRACPVDAPRSISVIVSIDATRRSVQDVEIPELASGSELAGCVRAALRGAPLPTTGALPSRLRLSFSVGR
ncbi:MAG: hypothetical protein OEY14_04965, partial [Myxococcales bacterium]|nr:hypothetical protein [Myxococcales bacterium]